MGDDGFPSGLGTPLPGVEGVDNYLPDLLRDMQDDLYDGLPESLVDDDDDAIDDAQKHWEESVKQLEHAVFFVLCPIFGKLIGRKVAHNLWVKFVMYRWKQYTGTQSIDLK